MFLMISSLHEIYLITNRYLILKNRNNWIVKIRLNYYIPILIILPIILVKPFSFIVKIVQYEKSDELYYWTWRDFIKTKYLSFYLCFNIFIQSILPLVILAIMSILCNREYKKRVQIKSKISIHSVIKLKKTEQSYIRITIIITALFIITRFSDFLGGSLMRGLYLLSIAPDKIAIALINFLRQFSYLIYFGLHSFNKKITKNKSMIFYC